MTWRRLYYTIRQLKEIVKSLQQSEQQTQSQVSRVTKLIFKVSDVTRTSLILPMNVPPRTKCCRNPRVADIVES